MEGARGEREKKVFMILETVVQMKQNPQEQKRWTENEKICKRDVKAAKMIKMPNESEKRELKEEKTVFSTDKQRNRGEEGPQKKRLIKEDRTDEPLCPIGLTMRRYQLIADFIFCFSQRPAKTRESCRQGIFLSEKYEQNANCQKLTEHGKYGRNANDG